MHGRLRHLRSLAICLTLLLCATQTLAVAHLHVDDAACVVCPHNHPHSACVDAAPPPAAQAPAGDHGSPAHVPAPGVGHEDTFQARAPPASSR